MGGIGSGRRVRSDRQLTVEDVKALDIRNLVRLGLFKSRSSGVLSWESGGAVTDKVRFRDQVHSLELEFTYSVEGGKRKSVSQYIELERTPSSFGGERIWFLCPECSKRVGILYVPTIKFLCRTCHNLPYASQVRAGSSAILDRLLES